MKVRVGFVTNSSSSSFVIVNKSKKTLYLKDFVEENWKLFEKVIEENDIDNDDGDNDSLKDKLLKDAEENNRTFKPGRPTALQVGNDASDSMVYYVLYCMTDGKSKSFEWFAENQ